MANKVLKKNNATRRAEKPAKKVKTVAVKQTELKEMPKSDFDYSTIRKATQQSSSKNTITYIVYDKHTEMDVVCCEHLDYLPKEVRAALEAKKII